MVPAQPPLPTAWNLPFHPDEGSHTSILMSESLLGVSVAATRQKAGSAANAWAAAPPRPPAAARPSGGAWPSAPRWPPAPPRFATGGVNAPAATVWAAVMVVFGSARADRLSHADPPAVCTGAVWNVAAASSTPMKVAVVRPR